MCCAFDYLTVDSSCCTVSSAAAVALPDFIAKMLALSCNAVLLYYP